jgi:plastocyanin
MIRLSIREVAMLAAITFLAMVALAACSGGGGGGGGGGPTGNQTGTITGTVTSGGAGVANVTVNLGGGGSTTTNASGSYTFANVTTGNRTVSIDLPNGFITGSVSEETSKSASVAAGQTATVNFTIKPGVLVQASGTSFNPTPLNIAPGTTVRWVAGNSTPHTVTPDVAGSFAGGTLPNTGSAVEATFPAAGTFNYHCEPHQSFGMTGSVVVQ